MYEPTYEPGLRNPIDADLLNVGETTAISFDALLQITLVGSLALVSDKAIRKLSPSIASLGEATIVSTPVLDDLSIGCGTDWKLATASELSSAETNTR